MTKREFCFEVVKDEMAVVRICSAIRENALHDAKHYALSYAEDGPFIIREATPLPGK